MKKKMTIEYTVIMLSEQKFGWKRFMKDQELQGYCEILRHQLSPRLCTNEHCELLSQSSTQGITRELRYLGAMSGSQCRERQSNRKGQRCETREGESISEGSEPIKH